MSEIPFPELRRVRDDTGSHIEPELDEDWSDLDKLRWHAAVVRVDNGGELALDVRESNMTINGERQEGYFDIIDRRSTMCGYTYDGAWVFINGVNHGLHIAGFEVRP